jgi:arabinosaccharide transport system permease protein
MARKSGGGFLFNQKIAPYIFIAPFVLSFAVFWVFPMIYAFYLSTQGMVQGDMQFVGWRNFKMLSMDRAFFDVAALNPFSGKYSAITNSLQYCLLTLVLLIPFPMLWATLMDSHYVKAKGVFKAFLYAPALTSVVVSSIIFRLGFSEMPDSTANQIYSFLIGQPTVVKWLNYHGTAYFCLLIICCWRWTGVNMLYFLSGLNSIDTQLYEAAEIDGCTKWQKFVRITLPLLKPTTIYVLTISIFAGLSMFMEVYMLMGNGGPKNIALTIVGYLYRRGMENANFGYASAVGLVLMVIALTVNILQLMANGTIKVGKNKGEA